MNASESVKLTRLPSDMQYSPSSGGYQSSAGAPQQYNVPSDPYLSTQNNMDADMYLEPSNNNIYLRNKQAAARRSTEHDSGILDEQPDGNSSTGTPRTSNTSVNTPSPPVPPYNRQAVPLPGPVGSPMGSKRPGSLAVRGHEYEELPGQKYLTSRSPYPNTAPQPTPPRPTQFGSINENLGSNGSMMSDKPPPPVYRKRQNPLYEEEKDAMVPKKSSANSRLCECPCVPVVFFSILSLVSFILVILLIAGVVGTSQSYSDPRMSASTSDYNYSVEYKELQERYQALLEKINRLEEVSSRNHSAISSRVGMIENDVTQIENTIDTVSKMQGPRGFNGSQGPPGAGDLSQCRHDIVTGGGAATARAQTPWFPPSASENQDRVILGLYCAIENEDGGGVYLETRSDSGVKQYRCVCHGQPRVQSTADTLVCRLHHWTCPEES